MIVRMQPAPTQRPGCQVRVLAPERPEKRPASSGQMAEETCRRAFTPHPVPVLMMEPIRGFRMLRRSNRRELERPLARSMHLSMFRTK